MDYNTIASYTYPMETIIPYIGLAYGLFLLGYWTAISILLYHLNRFGLGRHTKRIFYIVLSGSILLTIITSLVYIQI